MPISEVMTTTTTTTTTTSAESNNRPVSNRPTTTGSLLLNRENNSSSETNYLNFQTELLLTNNNNNNNGDNLNVNGRKYAKNAQKSIWSYNPDDISIRSKLVRNNHKNSSNNNNNGAGGENVRVGSGGFRAVVGSKDYFTNYFLNQQLQFKPSDLDVDQIHDHSDDKRNIDLFNHHYQQQQQHQHQHQQSIIRKQNGTPNTCSSSKTSYYQLPDEDNISKLPKNLISIDSFNYSLEKLIEKTKQDLFKMTPVVTTATAMTTLASSAAAVPSSPTTNHHQHYQMRTLSPRSKSTLPPTTNATTSSDSEANLKCQSSTSTNSNSSSNSSSSSSSSQKFAEFNQPIPARTTPTKLIEKYSCRLTNTGPDTNTHASNSKSTSNLTDDQLNVVNPSTKQSTLTSSDSTMKNDPFKNNISKLIKNRYTIETANKETENITSQSIKSTTSTLNRNTPVVCYAKHIDNLTPRTLENMSNGLNRNLLEPMGRPNNNNNSKQQNANANKTSQQKLATSDEATGGGGAARDRDRDYLDEIETFDDELNLDDNDLSDDEYNDDDDADEEEEDDDYIELDDDLRDIDYEDDKIIFETNISSSKQKQQQGIQLKNNLVMKICNDIKSYQLDDMARKRLLRRRLRKSKSAKLNAKSYAVNNDEDDEAPNEDDDADNKTLEERRQAVHEADRLNLNHYDEDNYDDTYDYEYEYKDVIGDDFRRLLDRYDGTINADQYLRQNLPSLDEYLSQVKVEPIPIILLDGEVEETIDDRVVRKKLEEERRRLAVEKARETYFFLKRMIIKKKYVMCTLKIERDTAAHKRGSKLKRTASILKSRPVTASVANLDNPSAFKAVSRPKTVNIIPVKQTMTGANTVSGETVNIREDGVDESVHQKYEKTTSTTADLMNEHESTYEIYRLSPNTLNTQKWPFEVEFAESKLTKSQSVGKRLGQQANSSSTLSKTKPAEKCYPCKKLPVMAVKSQPPTTNLQQQPVTNRTPSRNFNPTSLNRIKSSPSKLMKQPIDTEQSSSSSNTPTTSTVLNATYNSSRRSFLAKLNLAQKKIAPATTVIVVDGAELSSASPKTNNEPSSTDDSALYTDELKSTKKYLDVNLREQFRKMNILPGKTFKSQRKKSISIEHVPVSRKKIHTQKTRILLTAHSSANLANDPNDPKMISNQNYSVQNLNDNFQKSKSTLQQESADRVSVNDQLSRMIQAKPAASSSSSSSATSFSSNLKKNLALAIQHHEEIYSLIKSNHNNNNVSNNNQPSVKNAFIDNSLNTSPSLNSTDLSSFIFKASKYSLRNDTTTNSLVNSFNRNRPKTSKV